MAIVQDHLGISYSSFAEMCRHYDKDPTLVRARLRYNWDLETALTVDSNHYNGKVKDHLGNEYPNVWQMCKKYNIDKSLYFNRISKNWTVEQALTTPVIIKEQECTDHLGNVFKSKKERAEHYGLSSSAVESRLQKDMSLEDALKKKEKVLHKIGVNEFKNVRDAGAFYNVSRTTISKILKMSDDPIKRQECVDQILRSPAYMRWLENKGGVVE